MNSKEKQKIQNRIQQIKNELLDLEEKLNKKENLFNVGNSESAYFNYNAYRVGYGCYGDREDGYNTVPCKNQRIVEDRQSRHHLDDLLEKFAYDCNSVVTDDMWNIHTIMKHGILYNYFTKEYEVYTTFQHRDVNFIYFKDKRVAKKAIEEIIIPFYEMEINNNEK